MLASFSAVWGAKFNPSGAAMPLLVDLWAEGLAEMTSDEIRERFRVCQKTMAWPPNIAEFLGTEEGKPQSPAEWQQFGRRIGMEAAPGESWDGYITRLRRSWQRQPWRVQQSPQLEGPATRGVLTHDE